MKWKATVLAILLAILTNSGCSTTHKTILLQDQTCYKEPAKRKVKMNNAGRALTRELRVINMAYTKDCKMRNTLRKKIRALERTR